VPRSKIELSYTSTLPKGLCGLLRVKPTNNKYVTNRCQFGTADIAEIWGHSDGGTEIKILRHDAVQIGTDVLKSSGFLILRGHG
jgi:hypothetical protein